MKNKQAKQMICDVMERANPSCESNPVYRYNFGRYYCLNESNRYKIQPYQLCCDGFKVEQGVISLTANELKGK